MCPTTLGQHKEEKVSPRAQQSHEMLKNDAQSEDLGSSLYNNNR